MAGVSLDSRTSPKHLYAVAKPADAFRFDAVHNQGPCSFHAFSLPLTKTSKPIWSVDVRPVQAAFEKKHGVRPYGNGKQSLVLRNPLNWALAHVSLPLSSPAVASAQDSHGNSYMIFALGAPAIAKISADGKSITPWYFEKSNGSQRPGYTGITYDAATNSLIAFGGPRALTLFRLSDAVPTGHAVKINGNFGSLSGTEKIKTFPALEGAASKLLAAKAPYIYSFSTTDKWSSVSFKTFTRKEFQTDSLTSIIEYQKGSQRGVYGTGAYFSEGAHGGRKSTPAYKISSTLLE